MTAVTHEPATSPARLLTGWDTIEFWVGNARATTQLLAGGFGFRVTAYRGPETGAATHCSYVLTQGGIRVVVTAALDPASPVWDHVRRHGDGVRALSFAVEDVDATLAAALERGAELIEPAATVSDKAGQVRSAAVATYGQTVHRFTRREHPCFAPGFAADDLVAVEVGRPVGLETIDHVVGNVPEGRLDGWVSFYRDVFGFDELTHFNRDQISTEFSALRSTVMTNGTGITLPLNEPAEGRRRSQIQEYLDAYHGPGVQHIALATADIVAAVDELHRRGIRFLRPPASYYDQARERMETLGDGLRWEELARLGILVDREGGGYLLQVFTEPLGDRPTLFIEVIERHGAEGFGEGNFKALFEAIEREQARRGNL